jgi:acyl-CoA synthetase (AMP-forming)/AMP-acid ligase II
MVIRGGENIGCQEVEAAIYDHPCVSECAVFGVPDERLGESIAAVVMVKPNMRLTPDDVRAHVASHLARFKVPEHVWVRAEQLPRIASGKIYKRGLRDEAVAQLQAAVRKVSA